ncbi:MAG: biotin carboxylase N-terminal domain-containing protein [Chloroflexota bacterium]
MTTLLVANRGEIARRIFRTARRLNMRTVAVYSDADAKEPFAREADVAMRLGPPPAAESYLDIERVIAAAREAGADLVHPGYGFLAESPRFATAVREAGMRFVGPTPEVLAALGDKVQAKALAHRARVPVLPGYMEDDQRDEAFIEAAQSIGYPVMVKPVAGGGGIGMQRVREPGALQEALAKARRIASASFGDERLMLERLVERPRHVEVQLLADTHGQIFALGERDCSTQRRHQKILEETPAPSLEDEQRKALADAAIAIAREAKYTNAGTAEFIVDAKGRFAFLEVNARLQVEHPVTELVWDIDLVEQQLKIALGERISLGEPAPRGHAIEVRLYAEDVEGGFLPATGRIAHIRWPEGIRVDAGYEEGSAVTRHYDPLIAKLIAHGPHRKLALAKLSEALAQLEVLGVRTNLRFLRALAAHDVVQKGKVDTEFVKRSFEELVPERPAAPDEAYVLAAATVIAGARDPRDPWTSLGPWRLGEGYASTVTLREGDIERAVRLTGRGPYELNGHVAVQSQAEPHEWTIDANPAAAAREGTMCWVALAGEAYELDTAMRPRNVELTIGSEVAAPMPGVVIAAQTKADQKVRRGDLLFVVEAMKMELRVEAPADGTVTRVLASVGQQVERGQRLAEFEPASS